MAKVSQKDAVFNAVISVLTDSKITFELYKTKFKKLLNYEHRLIISKILFDGLKNKQIEIKSAKTDKQLSQYAAKIQSNWLQKDLRLNGKMRPILELKQHKIEKEDAQIKALLKFRQTLVKKRDIEEIDIIIQFRLQQMENAKKIKER
jgi:hypothetical protein